VFIGDEVVVRNASPNSRGQFSVAAPFGQHWRVEIFELATPPRSYARDNVDIKGPVNLGVVSLK
jgi:hypothetical protein